MFWKKVRLEKEEGRGAGFSKRLFATNSDCLELLSKSADISLLILNSPKDINLNGSEETNTEGHIKSKECAAGWIGEL